MKSDREFIDGIYEKARLIDLANQTDNEKEPSGSGHFHYRRFVPIAACILLLVIFIPSYFAWNNTDLVDLEDGPILSDVPGEERLPIEGRSLDPEIESFGINGTEGISEDMQGNADVDTASAEPNNFSLNNPEVGLMQLEQPQKIAEVKILDIAEQGDKYYILASREENILGSVESYLMIEYDTSIEKHTNIYTFTPEEVNVLYLYSPFSEAAGSTGVTEEDYREIYENLFPNNTINIDSDFGFYVMENYYDNRYIYKENVDGVKYYETVDGTVVTKDYFLQD